MRGRLIQNTFLDVSSFLDSKMKMMFSREMCRKDMTCQDKTCIKNKLNSGNALQGVMMQHTHCKRILSWNPKESQIKIPKLSRHLLLSFSCFCQTSHRLSSSLLLCQLKLLLLKQNCLEILKQKSYVSYAVLRDWDVRQQLED